MQNPFAVRALPKDVIVKIANEYLSVKDVWNLARSCKELFFGNSQTITTLAVVAKKMRLQELTRMMLTMCYDTSYWLVDGKLFCWGRNANFLGNKAVLAKTIVECDLSIIGFNALNNVKIIQVAVSYNYFVLLTEDENFFVWKLNGSGTVLLNANPSMDGGALCEFNLKRLGLSLTDKVKHLLAGDYHFFLLTEEGKCFVWGLNRCGQLGLGATNDSDFPIEFDVRRLNLSATDKVKEIAIVGHNNFLLTQEGRCFAWGYNMSGELGLCDKDPKYIPVELDFSHLNISSTDKVEKIFTGKNGTFVLTKENRCFAWGNSQCLAFHKLTQSNNKPTEFDLKRLCLSATDRIREIGIGESNILLLTEEGRCFAWSDRNQGGFRVKNVLSIENGVLIECDLKHLSLSSTDKVIKLQAFPCQTFLFTEQMRCFAQGYNYCGELGLSHFDKDKDSTRIDVFKEVFYPSMTELQLLIESVMNDRIQLAHLAHAKESYGEIFYRIYLRKISLEPNFDEKQIMIKDISSSCWHHPDNIIDYSPISNLSQSL